MGLNPSRYDVDVALTTAIADPRAHKRYIAVVSGANMNFDHLYLVAERAELRKGVRLSSVLRSQNGLEGTRSPISGVSSRLIAISLFALNSVISKSDSSGLPEMKASLVFNPILRIARLTYQ